MTEETVSVFANNRVFSGWEQISIDRSLESASGGFSLTVSGWNVDTIGPEAECRVAISDEIVLTGTLEGIKDSSSSKSHVVTVKGRSKTADVVDCSAVPQGFSNMSIDRIASLLCAPVGVDVVSDLEFPPIPSFRVQPGETIYSAIERAARKQFLLITDNAAGDLVLTRAAVGENPAGLSRKLVFGENILSRDYDLDWSGRFKTYKVHGQGATEGDVFHRQTGEVTDDSVRRNRTLLLVGGAQQPGVTPANRAEFERRMRLGKSVAYSCIVQGWRDSQDALWRTNSMVSVYDHEIYWFGVPMLVVSTVFEKTKEGATTTSLTLRPRQGYETPDATLARKTRGVVKRQKKGAIQKPWLTDAQVKDLE